MSTRIAASFFALTTALLTGALISHAGPLSPPAGSPASTYKTLSEVEPRIPLTSATAPGDSSSVFRIAQPGSYYLTGNVTGSALRSGIKIAASNVTVDLNGFTLTGGASSLNGIGIEGLPGNITIRNGVVRNWGNVGVDLGNAAAPGSLIENVRAEGNGAIGIRSSINGVVSGCTAIANGQSGIYGSGISTIESCSASSNSGPGITLTAGIVRDCLSANNTGNGFTVSSNALVTGCTAISNLQDGINAVSLARIVNNICNFNSDAGIEVAGTCSISENVCTNSFVGIRAGGAANVLSDNHVALNSTGLWVIAPGNTIVRNFATDNIANYAYTGGNDHGPSSDANTTNPWANISN